MIHSSRSLIALLLGLVAGTTHAADEAGSERFEAHEIRWSATPFSEYTRLSGRDAPAGLGGFFDQYGFVPNKGSSAPIEIGLRDATLDLLDDEGSSLLLVRFQSPTANLGISGSDADEPFWNQRLDVLAQVDRLELDLEYWRFRTEQLRLFPNTAGAGLVFEDASRADHRFQRDRTGFLAEAQLRLGDRRVASPALALRGGYEARDGTRQLRFHRDPSGQWLGLGQGLDRSVSTHGAGFVGALRGRATLAVDFDYERFRFLEPALTEGALGFAPPEATRTVGFVPSSDRYTGAVRLQAPLSERTALEAGVRFDQLEQSGVRTPDQKSAGLEDIAVRHFSVDAAVTSVLEDGWQLRATFDLDLRDKDMPLDNPLYEPASGSRFGPFLDQSRRIEIAGEVERALAATTRLSAGLTFLDVDRDLDFARYLPGTPRILAENAHIGRDSRSVAFHGRVVTRLARTVRLDGRIGYRIAPDTGYITELDDEVFGELRASGVVPARWPVMLSLFARGSRGENTDFQLVSGAGPNPGGPALERRYRRSAAAWGATASVTPTHRISIFSSLFMSWDDQDSGLDLSSLQRYFQDFGPFGFTAAGVVRYGDEQVSWTVGGRVRLGPRTDMRLAYRLTRAENQYHGAASSQLSTIASSHAVDARIHGLDLELRRELREGLRVFAGYRLQRFADGAPLHPSLNSAVAPFDRSATRHTLSFGVTLTGSYFGG